MQSDDLATVEYSAEYSLDPAAIASNEEGLVDPMPEGQDVEEAMLQKNQHLAAGASFGENKQ
jgi:hypothetical protein